MGPLSGAADGWRRVSFVRTAGDQIVRCEAPAKVNLTLAVHGKRPDGFHELESWVVTVGWFDALEFRPARRLTLDVRTPRPNVPTGPSNLVCQAAEALAEAAGRAPAVSIVLEKRLPVGAGLGGGSSDAAATLLGLNALWNLQWPIERLSPIAARLGADVPLFLECGPALIRGRGEKVEPAAGAWEGWLVLVVPSYGVSTASVYRLWSGSPARPPLCEAPFRRERPHDAAELARHLFNDLEAAAFACEPRLERLHAALDDLEGRPVRMTGSGSALFAVFDSETEAEDWCRKAQGRLGQGDELVVAPTVSGRQDGTWGSLGGSPASGSPGSGERSKTRTSGSPRT